MMNSDAVNPAVAATHQSASAVVLSFPSAASYIQTSLLRSNYVEKKTAHCLSTAVVY